MADHALCGEITFSYLLLAASIALPKLATRRAARMAPVNNSFTGVIAYTSSSRTCLSACLSACFLFLNSTRSPVSRPERIQSNPIQSESRAKLSRRLSAIQRHSHLGCVARFRITGIILACAERKQTNLARQRKTTQGSCSNGLLMTSGSTQAVLAQ